MKTTETVKVFLLGMIAAFIGMIALRPGQSVSFADTGGQGSAGGLIAVTGAEKSVLYVIDPTNKFIAQYSVDNARFMLRAARYCKYDLYIRDFNKKAGADVDDAKKLAKESMEQEEKDKE